MEKRIFSDKLSGSKVFLERIKPEHGNAMFTIIDKDREVLRPWLNWIDKMKTRENFEAYIQDRINWWKTMDMFTYVVREKENSPIIGMISFKEIDWERKEGHYVLWLSSEARGRGLSVKMYNLLADEAFSQGFVKVEAHVDSRNIASIKAIEKVQGFKYAKILENYEPDHIDASKKISWLIYERYRE